MLMLRNLKLQGKIILAIVSMTAVALSISYVALNMLVRELANEIYSGHLSHENAMSVVNSLTLRLLIGNIVGLAVLVVLICLVIKRVCAPLSKLVMNAGEMAKGSISVKFDTRRGDEAGMVSRAFAEVQASLASLADDTVKLSQDFVKGRLYTRSDESAYQGSFRDVIESVNLIAENTVMYLNNTDNSMVLFDDEYRVSFINQYLFRHGYSKAMIGKLISEVAPPELAQEIKAHFEETRATGQPTPGRMEIQDPTG